MLRLKRVREPVKCVKVEVVVRKGDRLSSLMTVPGQSGLGNCNWGLVIFWYTAKQFNAMVERLEAAGVRPKWETSFYYAYPHISDNRFKWNASRTESFIAD